MLDHVMIDIETLGTGHGAAILSIGAVKFNLVPEHKDDDTAVDTFYCGVDLKDAVRWGGKIDADTVRWWMLQEPAAREKAFGGKETVINSIRQLNDFVNGCLTFWANPPSFDLSILRAAAKRCGIDVSWSHRQERCYRTLASTVGKNIPRIVSALKHDPLVDCLAQVAHLNRVFDSLPASHL